MHGRHFYPDAHQRFPALVELPHLQPLRALLLSSAICEHTPGLTKLLSCLLHSLDVIWQLLYWKVCV